MGPLRRMQVVLLKRLRKPVQEKFEFVVVRHKVLCAQREFRTGLSELSKVRWNMKNRIGADKRLRVKKMLLSVGFAWQN